MLRIVTIDRSLGGRRLRLTVMGNFGNFFQDCEYLHTDMGVVLSVAKQHLNPRRTRLCKQNTFTPQNTLAHLTDIKSRNPWRYVQKIEKKLGSYSVSSNNRCKLKRSFVRSVEPNVCCNADSVFTVKQHVSPAQASEMGYENWPVRLGRLLNGKRWTLWSSDMNPFDPCVFFFREWRACSSSNANMNQTKQCVVTTPTVTRCYFTHISVHFHLIFIYSKDFYPDTVYITLI